MKIYNHRNRKFSLLALLLSLVALSQLTLSTLRPAASAAPRPSVSLAQAAGTVVGWGYNVHGQVNIPADLNNVTAIGVGYYHRRPSCCVTGCWS
ncbi:MAG: hypothetical protein ACREEM_10425 [Blastocatellia bacterium]